jgi:hypothetical protein
MRLFYALSIFITVTSFARPCGQEGSISERIKDCNISKGNFSLVTETEKGIVIYQDQKSGLIWGNRIPSDFNHYGSQKACDLQFSGYEVLTTLKWRLPTIKEFETAAANGIKSTLPNMDRAYWTSTPVKTKRSRRRRAEPLRVFLWDSSEEKTDTGDLKDGAAVRCVAKE